MKIKVGKAYRDRDGWVVRIVAHSGEYAPFEGDNGGHYNPDGTCPGIRGNIHGMELIEEVPTDAEFDSRYDLSDDPMDQAKMAQLRREDISDG